MNLTKLGGLGRGATGLATYFGMIGLLWVLVAASIPLGPATPTPWYQAVSMFRFPHIVASEFGDTDSQMLPELRKSREEYVLVYFFAPWCPHCQHFAPEFERLALAFRRQNKSAKPEERVLAGKVDCVAHASTCSDWGINGFPSLLWGRRTDWLERRVSTLRSVEPSSASAEGAADWINRNTPVRLDPSKVSRQEIAQLAHSGSVNSSLGFAAPMDAIPTAVDPWDMQLALALLVHETLERHGSETGPMRSLNDFVHLLAERFPEAVSSPVPNIRGAATATSCRASLRDLTRQLKPASATSGRRHAALLLEGQTQRLGPSELESRWRLCGTDWTTYGTRGWRSCRGTFPGKRGFTCGLWSLFHTVIAHGEDSHALEDTKIMRAVIADLFGCKDCRDHFLNHIAWSEKSTRTRRDAQIWWWQAHNQVNLRVQGIEQQYQDGDPQFPKVQWPSQAQCPSCHVQGGWNAEAVTNFLDQYYRRRE